MTPAAPIPTNQPVVDNPLLTQPWATVIGGACVVAAGLLAFFVAYYNRRQTEKHWRTTNRQERFTTIASQLADPAPAVRLAGVYAMEALIDDWLKPNALPWATQLITLKPSRRAEARTELAQHGKRQAQTCINVLCSYLRLTPPKAPQAPNVYIADGAHHTTDSEVRSSIITTMVAHLQPDPPGETWSDCNYNFDDVDFDNLSFNAAVVRGSITFRYSRFHGVAADFVDTQFEGTAIFSNATFNGYAFFTKAEFYEAARFVNVEFKKMTVFNNAEFHDETKFDRATFTGATIFSETQFHSIISFNQPRAWNVKTDWDENLKKAPPLLFPADPPWPPTIVPKPEPTPS